jgi:pimeloyl-ACP methyl ester carboxylesterase
VGRGGVEPPTFRFSGGRSYQLSYLPRVSGLRASLATRQTGPVEPTIAEQTRAAGELAGRGLAATAGLVRDTHLAIAKRAFTLSGRAGKPVRVTHNLISRSVYATVGGGVRAMGVVAGTVASTRDSAVTLSDRPRGNAVIGALNGAWGDRLTGWSSPLALRMTLRHDDRDLAVDRGALARAYPDATGDLVVFVHGLCETDAFWRWGAVEHYGDKESTHGKRLRAAAGTTPLYLRYNTGRHVCDNGDELAELLTHVIDEWPVPVTRLTLVGHSMGGLVIRAACHRATTDEVPWLPLVTRIAYLGSPHLGAPLEVAVTALGVAMRRLPETRPLADALATRSVGIKDLRFGDIRAEDWADVEDIDARRRAPIDCAPLLETATHYYVGATLGRRNDTVAARVLGDAFVPWTSAAGTGRRRRLALDVDHGRHLGGLHHFDLLNHPRVYAVLEEWLAR